MLEQATQRGWDVLADIQLDKPLSSLSQFLPALLEKWDQENRSHFQIMLFCDSAVKSQ